MAQIDVQTEEDADHGWRFVVAVTDDGRRREHEVTLAWADYDLWCRGRSSPQRVIETAFEFLLEREPSAAILGRFDCALIRRFFPEVDRVLPERI